MARKQKKHKITKSVKSGKKTSKRIKSNTEILKKY